MDGTGDLRYFVADHTEFYRSKKKIDEDIEIIVLNFTSVAFVRQTLLPCFPSAMLCLCEENRRDLHPTD